MLTPMPEQSRKWTRASDARLFTRENGKILFESRPEAGWIGYRFKQVASYAKRLARDEEIGGPPFDRLVTRQPRGVAVLIVPWNWPLSILASKLPLALLAGNTLVAKPSEFSTLISTQALHLIAAVMPPGVIRYHRRCGEIRRPTGRAPESAHGQFHRFGAHRAARDEDRRREHRAGHSRTRGNEAGLAN